VVLVDGVAASIARFIPAKIVVRVLNGFFATLRCGSVVAVMRIVAVVDVAVEVAATVIPGPRADEDTAGGP
jgi:hypothetical protein